MRIKESVRRFDQGGVSKAYVVNELTLSLTEESGWGGEVPVSDVLACSEDASGASELASVVAQKLSELRRDFFGGEDWQRVMENLQRGKTEPPAFFETSTVRPGTAFGEGRVSEEAVDGSFFQIENEILERLEADPVEDGYSHPAEAILENVIREFGERAGDWLQAIFSKDRWNASFRAGLLRLLSRQKPFTEGWRVRVIQSGLSSPNIELRDAAVQAAEAWEDAGAINLLQAQKEKEPCAWLVNYLSCVIRDLMG